MITIATMSTLLRLMTLSMTNSSRIMTTTWTMTASTSRETTKTTKGGNKGKAVPISLKTQLRTTIWKCSRLNSLKKKKLRKRGELQTIQICTRTNLYSGFKPIRNRRTFISWRCFSIVFKSMESGWFMFRSLQMSSKLTFFKWFKGVGDPSTLLYWEISLNWGKRIDKMPPNFWSFCWNEC